MHRYNVTLAVYAIDITLNFIYARDRAEKKPAYLCMGKTTVHIPFDLGVATINNKVFLYTNLIGFQNPFHLSVSKDGFRFKGLSKKQPSIITGSSTENTSHAKGFHVSKIGKLLIATYQQNNSLCIAKSHDGITWTKLNSIEQFNFGVVVPSDKDTKNYFMYTSNGSISLSTSKNLLQWENIGTVLSPRQNYFDRSPLTIESVIVTNEGIVLFYWVREQFREGISYSIGVALFDKNDPSKLIWQRDGPVFTQQENEGKHLYPVGIVNHKNRLLLYFGIFGESVFTVYFENFGDIFNTLPTKISPLLEKHPQNPIVQPVIEHYWESQAAFNPAAMNDNGKIHLVYRAMGNDTSYLGYANSIDGTTIEERSKKPIFSPSQEFDLPNKYPNIMYMSGGGYGGCEDPRLSKIEEDEKIYLTYIAYNGSDPPRVALSSISLEDFRRQNWEWETPRLISPPNIVDKNACIFPEKINGKYAILHRIFPNILLDFVDDLDFNEGKFLKGEYIIQPSEEGWDSRKIGAGAPPIKTKDGWLLIYHAVDDKNDSQYKIGAMLLDLNDPTKVLHRSTNPILTPTEWYENHGFKAGVAYPCGAVVLNGNLYVYYGGADKVVCVAKKKLDVFLEELKNQKTAKPLSSLRQQTVLQHNYAST